MKAKREREILEVCRVWMIHKDSDECYKRGELLDDLGSLRCIDVSWAVGIKVQADRVRSQQYRVACVFELRNAADFDACHSNPRRVSAASDDVRKCSPMRNASAPASRRRAISARS